MFAKLAILSGGKKAVTPPPPTLEQQQELEAETKLPPELADSWRGTYFLKKAGTVADDIEPLNRIWAACREPIRPVLVSMDVTMDGYRRTALHQAAEGGKLSVVRWLIAVAKADVNAVDKDGRTPLYLAVRRSNLEMVQCLVVEFHADLEVAATAGWRVLHRATYNNFAEIVQFLLTAGADRSALTTANYQRQAAGSSALDIAQSLSHVRLVRLLVQSPATRVPTSPAPAPAPDPKLAEWYATHRLESLADALEALGVRHLEDLLEIDEDALSLAKATLVERKRFLRVVQELRLAVSPTAGDPSDALRPQDLVLGPVIGAGSSSIVYSCSWNSRRVAAKVVRAGFTADELRAAEKSLAAEVELMRAAGPHAAVVPLIGLCVLPEPTRLCLVTEFMPGGNLLQHLRSNAGVRSDLLQLTAMAAHICSGLVHLHAKGIIHRDLAARNVFIDAAGHARIGDFGYSRLLPRTDDVAVTHASVGPIRWMAPECLIRHEYSQASDMWAFGVLMFELAAGGTTLPWPDHTLPMVASRVIAGETAESSLPPDTDATWRKVMQDCWRFQPHERPTAAQVHAALQTHVQSLQEAVPAPGEYDYVSP